MADKKSSPEHDAGKGSRRDFLKRSGALVAGVGAGAFIHDAQTAPLNSREVRRWDATVDVVVMGSGVAGTAAAIEVRRANADVLLLEKFHVPGGSSSLSGGVCYMGGGTPLQKTLGFSDSVEDMYNYMVAASGIYAEQEKIRLYCEGSLEQFQWLIDNGIVYSQEFSAEKELTRGSASLYFSGNERSYPYCDIAKPVPRGHLPSAENQTGGRRMMQALLASAKQLGVQLKLRASCERLIQEADGSVSGVQINDGNQVRHIRARKGVVLAAGGFIHNRDMVKRYAPEMYQCSAPWGRAGDLGIGIQMGMSIGGEVLRMDQGFTILPLYPPENVLRGIVVSRQGQRFVNEDAYYAFLGHEIAFHQNHVAYLIVDRDSDYPGSQDYRVNQVAQADSISTLEQQLHLPMQALQHTVDYYNRFARKGSDPLFGKNKDYLAALQKGPFKAYELSGKNAFFVAHTFGGLHTNNDAQVINAWGDPIPGLYAAGRTAASIPVSPYIASGVSVGDGIFFGRRAARHALQRKA